MAVGAPEQGETQRQERKTARGAGNSSQNVSWLGVPAVGSAHPIITS
jgi:hypothetical protein